MKKILSLIAFIGCLMPGFAFANARGPASIFVEKLFEEGFTAAQNRDLSDLQRANKLEQVLKEYFPVRALGRDMISDYKNEFTVAQKEEYLNLFARYIVAIYKPHLEKVASERGAKLRIIGEKYNDDRKDVTTVMTKFLRSDKEAVNVDWLVLTTTNPHHLFIINVGAEGVWFGEAIKAQIVAIIKNHGAEGLLNILQEKVSELEKK